MSLNCYRGRGITLCFSADHHQTDPNGQRSASAFTRVRVTADRTDGGDVIAEPRRLCVESWDRTSGETEAMLSPRGTG